MIRASLGNKMDRDVLSVCIELVLLRMGVPEYEKVVSKLKNDYGCAISDCGKNPEFLKRVLQDTFGDGHKTIVNQIKKELGEEVSKKYFANFIAVMKK